MALATKFLSNARPTLQSGLLEAHLTLILENQRSDMISLWDQFCTTRNRLTQIQHWMIRYFPDSSAMWVTDSPGYHVEISGDAILLSKCHIITSYKVFWNRSISYKCFREIPVQLLPSKTVKFLQFNQRKLISQGTRIFCDTRPNFIFFEDQNSILWHLSHNGNLSIFDSTPLFTPMHFLDFKFPNLRGLNSHLVRPHCHTIDRTTLLDIVSHNHQFFQEIASISQVGQGSFLSGLGTLFGITIQSIAKGGGPLINDLGHDL